MEYKKAQEIRNKSLISLIAENKFKKDMGLGASIGGAISSKFKARSVGFKETFDPLNIVRGLTGKGTFGKIATTIAGRTLGRSEKDISYFGGYSRRLKTQQGMTNISPLGSYGGEASAPTQSPLAGILGEMYQFMQKTHEVDKKDFEIQQAYIEEQNSDAEIRHKQLVRAIKKYIKLPANPGEAKKEDSGIMGWIMNLWNDFKNTIENMLKPITEFMKSFGKNVIESLISFGGFLTRNPATLSALLWLVGLYKAKEFLDETKFGERMAEGEGKIAQKAFKEKKTDFSHMPLNKDQAAAILEQPESPGKKRDIESFGGIERIQAIAQGKPDPGGVSLQKPVDNTVPTNQTKEFKENKAKVTSTSSKTQVSNNETNVSVTPANSVPVAQPVSSVGTSIPSQIDLNTTTSPNGAAIAVTNSTNNIGGGPAQVYNMNSIDIRNSDLFNFLKKSSVPV